MSTSQDQAKSIAERVARRVSSETRRTPIMPKPSSPAQSGSPVKEELSAIRETLHDLERKLENIESKIVSGANSGAEWPRARVVDFVSSNPPTRSAPSVHEPSQARFDQSTPQTTEFVPLTHSPWLRDFYAADHPSQERFGVEEAAVSEMVEYFEKEKQCSVDPSGKPCDHCAMCSSRGF